MEKKKVVLALILSIFIVFSLATGAPTDPGTPPAQSTIEDMPATGGEGTTPVTEPTPSTTSPVENIQSKSNEFFEKEVTIPERLEPITRTLLRMGSSISFSLLIVALCLLVMFFLLFHDTLKTFGPFSETSALLIALMLTLVAGATGVILQLAKSFLQVGNYIRFLGEWSAGLFALVIVVFFLVLIGWRKLFKHIKLSKLKEERAEMGIKIGANELQTGIINKMYSKIADASSKSYGVIKTPEEMKKRFIQIIVILALILLVLAYLLLRTFT